MSTQIALHLPTARWDAAVEEHRLSVAAYVESGGRLDDAAWHRPWAAGKWTPAHITEHLTLAYDAAIAELCEGTPMKPRLSPWRQRLSRWVVLPHILFHRSIPLRVRAPRELRPEAPRAPQREALRMLEQQSERFEDHMGRAFRAGTGRLTHPYFGELDPVRAVRFCAVHLEHHRRQIERLG